MGLAPSAAARKFPESRAEARATGAVSAIGCPHKCRLPPISPRPRGNATPPLGKRPRLRVRPEPGVGAGTHSSHHRLGSESRCWIGSRAALGDSLPGPCVDTFPGLRQYGRCAGFRCNDMDLAPISDGLRQPRRSANRVGCVRGWTRGEYLGPGRDPGVRGRAWALESIRRIRMKSGLKPARGETS